MLEVSVQSSTSIAGPNRQELGSEVLFVTSMAVKEPRRRQGIGAALLRAAEEWSAPHHSDISHAALLVYRNNYDAIRYCG